MTHPDFPRTQTHPFKVTSAQTVTYNCIAWAYGVSDRWYWPDPFGFYYWPPALVRSVTVQCFILLFESAGYDVCTSDALEIGMEKIAIFTDPFGKPTHAARQLQSGEWTSKLGSIEDVTHDLFNIQEGIYGNVSVIMRRKIPT